MGYIFEKSPGTNKLEGQSEFLRCSLPTPLEGTILPPQRMDVRLALFEAEELVDIGKRRHR